MSNIFGNSESSQKFYILCFPKAQFRILDKVGEKAKYTKL